MKTTYCGAPTGVGSIYEWEGNSKVGKGRMEVTSIQPAKTSIKLDFLKPFEGHNTADFVLKPDGSATRVTWVMYGSLNFVLGKLMSVFITMDKMIGDDFQRGLANLKAASDNKQSLAPKVYRFDFAGWPREYPTLVHGRRTLSSGKVFFLGKFASRPGPTAG